jgi:hypothetical protein
VSTDGIILLLMEYFLKKSVLIGFRPVEIAGRKHPLSDPAPPVQIPHCLVTGAREDGF